MLVIVCYDVNTETRAGRRLRLDRLADTRSCKVPERGRFKGRFQVRSA